MCDRCASSLQYSLQPWHRWLIIVCDVAVIVIVYNKDYIEAYFINLDVDKEEMKGAECLEFHVSKKNC